MPDRPKPTRRASRRNIAPGSMTQVVIAVKRDLDRATERHDATIAVLGSHTLWEHEDGRDLCDFDGDPWPCSTVIGLAFIYGVVIPEQWERDTASTRSAPKDGAR